MRFEKVYFRTPILIVGFALNVCAQQSTRFLDASDEYANERTR